MWRAAAAGAATAELPEALLRLRGRAILAASKPLAASLGQWRFLSAGVGKDDIFESADEFERRLFGDVDQNADTASFYRKLDKVGWNQSNSSSGPGQSNQSRITRGFNETYDTLDDGMDDKLRRASQNFVFTGEEEEDEDYAFRPDVTFYPGNEYEPEDLDLTRAAYQERNNKKFMFNTTTKEVLRKADFRNVRFLSKFLTEAGIIIKRRQTGISAKAQRKVAREIKTARAFGLMPFTTMGTKPFIFGRNMKDDDEDYASGAYDRTRPTQRFSGAR